MPFHLKPYSKKHYEDQTKRLKVLTLPARSDNYTFLVLNENKNSAILVDSADHSVVLKALKALHLNLECVLLTHHHFDHVDGLDVILSEHPQAKLYCSEKDAKRGVFDSACTIVKEGDIIKLFDENVTVIETPGHTVSHLSYYFSESEALFCGDTLFSLGCGRVFEKETDIFKTYYKSLQSLKSIVKHSALVFCAHEYTKSNLKFCEQENLIFGDVYKDLRKRLKNFNHERTVPTQFDFELKHNPFLKACSHQELKRIRTLKDRF